MALKSEDIRLLISPPSCRQIQAARCAWGAAIGRQPVSEWIRTMESVIGEGIVSYESTLAIAATIVLGLLNQSRLAQRAVRYTLRSLPSRSRCVSPTLHHLCTQAWEARRAAWVKEQTSDHSPQDLAARRAAWVYENTVALQQAEPPICSRPPRSCSQRPSFEAPSNGMVAC